MALRVQDLVNLAIKIRDEFNILFLVADETFLPLLIENEINFICLHCKDSKYYVKKAIHKKRYVLKFLETF